MKFTFQPKWKELLICDCLLGQLVLDMPMGNVSVDVPSEISWMEVAPDWAKPFWTTFYEQLQVWCKSQNIPLYVDDYYYSGRKI